LKLLCDQAEQILRKGDIGHELCNERSGQEQRLNRSLGDDGGIARGFFVSTDETVGDKVSRITVYFPDILNNQYGE